MAGMNLLNQNQPTSTSGHRHEESSGNVFCFVSNHLEFDEIVAAPEVLDQIGFTGMVVTDHNASTDSLKQRGFQLHDLAELKPVFDLSQWVTATPLSSEEIWMAHEKQPYVSLGVDIAIADDLQRRKHEAATLFQIAASPVPVVRINAALLYSTTYREQRELLRSLVFWRKRFEVSRHRPRLVHSGDDGLLIFIIDSWLISVNMNPDEATIDLGQQGSMWLMLGSQRDVHLHGSMLVLPPYSGAIVANEAAR